MMSVPGLRIWLKLSIVFLVLVSACITFVASVEAAPKEQVRLKVIVTVINQAGGAIEGATVVIIRKGTRSNNGEDLDDVDGKTGKDGIWPGEVRDYPEKDTPYILQVSAHGYKAVNDDKYLSFQNLKDASAKGPTYPITVSMINNVEGEGGKEANSGVGVNGAVGINGVDAGAGNPIGGNTGKDQVPSGKGRQGEQSTDDTFMATLVSGIGTVLRWLAWLSLALLTTALLAYVFFGMRFSFYRVGEPTWRQDIGALISRLSRLEENVAETIRAQGTTNQSLEEMCTTLTAIQNAPAKTVPPPPPQNYNTKPPVGDINGQDRTYQKVVAHTLPQDEARNAYRNLVTGNATAEDFIYLSAEGGTALGKLEDKYVYLSEDSAQGAFVLFTVDGERGWVFPNPSLRFRPSALRPVFPQMTEEMFESNKEDLPPNEASNAGAGRWRVEPSQG
jgi:hypothetical protein